MGEPFALFLAMNYSHGHARSGFSIRRDLPSLWNVIGDAQWSFVSLATAAAERREGRLWLVLLEDDVDHLSAEARFANPWLGSSPNHRRQQVPLALRYGGSVVGDRLGRSEWLSRVDRTDRLLYGPERRPFQVRSCWDQRQTPASEHPSSRTLSPTNSPCEGACTHYDAGRCDLLCRHCRNDCRW